ncbi:Intraflagellar transport protein 27 [Lamellibrachia satsuma]|nr:Intraflagellar transport protein 27 [Lamellibrachia satsuma]
MSTVLRAECIVVGDSTVGKSAITQVFHSDGSHFPKAYVMTTGVEMCTKNINIPDSRDTVELFIFDSAGKELFAELVQKYWDNPSLVMIVYDVTNEMSFKSCEKWLKRVLTQNPNISCPGVLVGNKTDLEERRVVSEKMARQFAEANSLEYFECSAKEMQNVDQPFYFLANAFHKLYQEKLEVIKSLG